MRTAAASLHDNPAINWIDDRLPALGVVSRSGLAFDLILLSAVWMHVPESDRRRAFRKMISLLRPGGLMAITLRLGPADLERGFHSVSPEEVEALARDHGAFVEKHTEARDLLDRNDVRWIQMAVRLPDDGTGALPLLRHVILNDEKSSTYKLALLRTLSRVADGAAGFARHYDDDHVAVPLGLNCAYLDPAVKPLLSAAFPKAPPMSAWNAWASSERPTAALTTSRISSCEWVRDFRATFPPVLHQALGMLPYDREDARHPHDLPGRGAGISGDKVLADCRVRLRYISTGHTCSVWRNAGSPTSLANLQRFGCVDRAGHRRGWSRLIRSTLYVGASS